MSIDSRHTAYGLQRSSCRNGAFLIILGLAVMIISAGCTSGPSGAPAAPPGDTVSGGPKEGDSVRVWYTVAYKDGRIFESNINKTPFQFTVGSPVVRPFFNAKVRELTPGESKVWLIPAGEAFGQYREDLVKEQSSSAFPPGFTPVVGDIYRFTTPDGTPGTFTVVKISGDIITVDTNHPLAGQDIVLTMELVGIVPPGGSTTRTSPLQST